MSDFFANCVPVISRCFHTKESTTLDSRLPCIGEKVMQMTNHIEAIHFVNFVNVGTLTMTNCTVIYEETTSFVISAMPMGYKPIILIISASEIIFKNSTFFAKKVIASTTSSLMPSDPSWTLKHTGWKSIV